MYSIYVVGDVVSVCVLFEPLILNVCISSYYISISTNNCVGVKWLYSKIEYAITRITNKNNTHVIKPDTNLLQAILYQDKYQCCRHIAFCETETRQKRSAQNHRDCTRIASKVQRCIAEQQVYSPRLRLSCRILI